MYYLKTSYRKNYLGILFYNSPLGWQPQSVACMFPTAAHPQTHPQPKLPDETELETQMRENIRNRNSWDIRLLEIFVQRWDDVVVA